MIRCIRCMTFTALIFTICCQVSAKEMGSDISVQRLTWAGIKLVAGDTSVFIDAVGTDIWEGDPPGGLVPLEATTSRRYALVSHAHNDHLDVNALKAVLGERGYVICHESIATYIASRGLKVIAATMYEPVRRGGFLFTAVPAADGFGASQISWVVSRGDQRYLHAGDTLWHGNWDTIGVQYGPFDAVFLPINAARIRSEPLQETPGVMTPAQAVDAAVLLRAKAVVPIHYGGHNPPGYIEIERPLERFREEAERRKVPAQVLRPGDYLR